MKMRESALWKSLLKYVPIGGMAVRIENSLNSGMPDVLMTYAGKTLLIELKADLEISKMQADWARRWADSGGTSWFLIAMNNAHYLVPGKQGGWLRSRPDTIYKWRVNDIRDALEKMLK